MEIIIPIYFIMSAIVPFVLYGGYKASRRHYKLGRLNGYISQKERNNKFLNE